jgi:hypothetical protein
MTATTAKARKVFRVLGTTDDFTTCELCGREELKGTVVLQPLDADGNPDGDPVYFGSSCGAKAAGWTTREVVSAAKRADQERREAERAKREAEHNAWIDARDAWIASNVGRDAMAHPRRYGFSGPVAIVRHYMEQTGVEWPS